jgi:phosphatidylinositol alpha-1,6-mannosyltransferase
VREGRSGHVVDGRDVPALADVLVGLLDDPARAAAMGAAGRAWMREEWGWRARAARLSALLGTAHAAQAGCLRPA